ncbi:MAG TPA: hypothetical protein VH934_01020 [Xanthobacteraceae bacterium]|jgi:hypothetical protein
MSHVTRRAALLALSAMAASPLRAQPAGKPQSAGAETAELEQPAVLDITPKTGSLKETVQKGQALIWRQKQGQQRLFRVDSISVALLRDVTGTQVKITFSANTTSLGYSTSGEAKLNLSIRTKAGAALYAWSFGIAIKCGDNNKPLTPLTHQMPMDISANAFANAGSVEIAQLSGPDVSGAKIQRCD